MEGSCCAAQSVFMFYWTTVRRKKGSWNWRTRGGRRVVREREGHEGKVDRNEVGREESVKLRQSQGFLYKFPDVLILKSYHFSPSTCDARSEKESRVDPASLNVAGTGVACHEQEP